LEKTASEYFGARARLGPERRVECVQAWSEQLDLAPGGHFVFADQMRGGAEAYHAINWGRMTDFWKRPGHLVQEERDSLTEHAELHDHYVTAVDQLRWMEAVGFTELDCVWRNWMWGILSGRKS